MTELNKRLKHIVECSSQLIFVTAETFSCQQKALTEFLSDQDNDTDVSFFKADKAGNSDNNRLSIYSQITGNYSISSTKDLKHSLNLDTQPDGSLFLVCISQAELLETNFVFELWDWITSAQNYKSNVRLSVLLFCESNWAHKTHKLLPNHSDSCPILISEDTKDPVGFDVNALESLMNDKHSWFSANNRPLVANKWFLASIALIFTVTFASLMSLHYSNETTSEDATLTNSKSTEQSVKITNIKSTEKSAKLTNSNSIEQDVKATISNSMEQDHIILKTFSVDDFTIDTALHGQTSQSIFASNYTEMTSPVDNVSETQEREPKNNIDLQGESVTTPSHAPASLETASLTNVTNKEDAIDFRVDDITNVEQLSKVLSNTQMGEKNPSSSIVSKNKTDIDYRFDETTLLSLPTNAVVLQLSGIQNPVVLKNFLKNNNLETSTWVYETQRYGGPWYVVTYNQVFDSIESAVNNVPRLPDVIKESQPFAKSINQIQKEIRTR